MFQLRIGTPQLDSNWFQLGSNWVPKWFRLFSMRTESPLNLTWSTARITLKSRSCPIDEARNSMIRKAASTFSQQASEQTTKILLTPRLSHADCIQSWTLCCWKDLIYIARDVVPFFHHRPSSNLSSSSASSSSDQSTSRGSQRPVRPPNSFRQYW